MNLVQGSNGAMFDAHDPCNYDRVGDMPEPDDGFTYCEDTYSDLHKDAFGFRPMQADWMVWRGASPTHKQAIWDSLIDQLGQRVAEEKAEQQLSIAKFEATVTRLIDVGAGDRISALRWLMDASICAGDWEFLCFEHGLPYRYFVKDGLK